MNTTDGNGADRDKLMSDLKTVIQDAESMLRGTGQQLGSGYEAAREAARAKFESTLQSAKSSYGTLQEQVVAGSQDAMDATERYVQANPWQAVGIGAAAGLVLGLLIGRGR